MSDALKTKIAGLPHGLLHLEAGIQSLDSAVLTESGRKGSLDASIEGLKFLCSLTNVQTHADLIAGLPLYTLEMLCNDIVELVKIGVDELQVESLKVLPGTRLRKTASVKGLRFSPLPPYEILQTPSISPSELRTAMHVSRMVDLYYNCPAWQKVTGTLITQDLGFLMDFTAHLHDMMVLDSPVSVERRGVILYHYCREHHPQMLPAVSIAWIKAGLSLKKEPAGNIIKVKNIDAYLTDNDLTMAVGYGTFNASDRHYVLTCGTSRILFGYDSEIHHPEPVFMARLGDVAESTFPL